MKSPPYRDLVLKALREDAAASDITSRAVFGKKSGKGKGFFLAKEDLVVSGMDLAREVFRLVSPSSRFLSRVKDGQKIKKGKILAVAAGSLSDLLAAERTALNFLQHLSGIATLTRRYVDAVKPYRCAIMDTRKTIPGLRLLQKKAVADGGGKNHRMDLSGAFLIKDNHIAACGGVLEAVRRVRQTRPVGPIEVEVTNLPQLREVLAARADIILLDNMKLPLIRKTVALAKGRAFLEVSGGVTLKNVRKIAATGAHRISVGKLTHSAPAVDISFEIYS